MKKLFVFIFLLTSLTYTSANEKIMKVIFLNPATNTETEIFWNDLTNFMKAAVQDLGNIDLEVIYSNRSHIKLQNQVKEILTRKEKPDFILTGNEKYTAGHVIQLIEGTSIKVFVINNPFVGNDVTKYIKPRIKYENWIGQYFPDNILAGYIVAQKLIKECIDKNITDENGKINLLVIGGAKATSASDDRLKGMEKAVKEYNGEVEILQSVYTDWTEEDAFLRVKGLLSRYSNQKVCGIWVASDSPGLGAAKAVTDSGKEVGKDILLGSVGWAQEAINKVKSGTLVTTVGGHFMDGAWAIIMLYDYFHGKDFIDDFPSQVMSSIDKDNVNNFYSVFSKQEWSKIDFNKFSKANNTTLKTYDFSLDKIFNQLK